MTLVWVAALTIFGSTIADWVPVISPLNVPVTLAAVAELPLMLIPHVPVAPAPDVLGTPRFDLAEATLFRSERLFDA